MSSSRSPAAAVDEGNAKTAAREWVGWEEQVVPGDGDGEERKVCYYLRCAPPQDGGKSERDLAVVGKYWGPGNIAYSADLQFLLSLDKALDSPSASARVEALASEITGLRWKSRKEVMEWLTSLVADPPYGAFGLTRPDHHDGGSHASKVTPSTLAAAGENKEGFTWICKLPHLDQRRKHYKSFCRKGVRISVHDFVYIKSGGRESHVAYVEDMYEDGRAKNMVLARWLEKPDDEHGAVVPPDLYRREVFFGYGLQDLGVEFVEGVAAVLNPQHFEMFKKINGGRSSWQPHVCRRQIEDHTVGPFDITQLQGYANQEIVKAIVAASPSTTVVHDEPPNNKGKAAITGLALAAQNHAGSSSAVTGDKTMQKQKQKLPPCSATSSSSSAVTGDKTKQMPPPCSAIPSSNSVIGDKTMEKQKQKLKPPPCSATPSSSSSVVIVDKTMEKQKEMPPPCSSATPQSVSNGQTVVESSVVPRNAVNRQTAAQNQQPPSAIGTGNAAANDASAMVNPEKLFQPGCRLEALCQDSSVRGCWYRCVVLNRREEDNSVRVRYQDLPNAEGKGQLREWLRAARIAEPDHLGIRHTKRPMLRPQLPTRYRKIESPVAVGVIVDARLNGGWWEGIVLQQETAGHVKVYLQGEGRLVDVEVESLRKSFEWCEEQWMPLDARKDVAAKITLDLKKKGVLQSAMKKAAGSSSKQKAQAQAQKKGEQSGQKAAAAAPRTGLLPGQPLEEGDDESANCAPPRKRFLAQGYSFEEKRLETQAKKKKGPADEAAKPAAEEGDGMSRGRSSADAKRCRVDPTNSDGLNGAERKGKARKSSGPKKMGSSSQGSSQGGASGSGSSGGAALVNPVPMEEICVTNGEAPGQSPVTIDLTMYD